jgi:hypothetical protein
MIRRWGILLLATMTLFVGVSGGTMTPQYSRYLNQSADQTYLYLTAAVDGTTTGCNYPPYCINVYHTGKVYLKVGSTGNWVYGSQVNPANYLSVSNAQTIQFVQGQVYSETDEEDVYCSGLGHNIFSFPQTAQVEVAVTQAVWPGSPPPVCGLISCVYPTQNSCISRPDASIAAVRSGDFPGATRLTWITLTPCIRFSWPGPWSCAGVAFAQLLGLNATLPPYACTSNP